MRNWVATLITEVGMALARLGDRLYDCKPEDIFEPGHIDHDCNYRKGDC